ALRETDVSAREAFFGSPCARASSPAGRETRTAPAFVPLARRRQSDVSPSAQGVAGMREEERAHAVWHRGPEAHARERANPCEAPGGQQARPDVIDHPGLQWPGDPGERHVEELPR